MKDIIEVGPKHTPGDIGTPEYRAASRAIGDYALTCLTDAALCVVTEEQARQAGVADELLEALDALADQANSLLAELDYQKVTCPLCGEDPGEGEDALCGVVKALGEASSKADAALARARGEG